MADYKTVFKDTISCTGRSGLLDRPRSVSFALIDVRGGVSEGYKIHVACPKRMHGCCLEDMASPTSPCHIYRSLEKLRVDLAGV